MICGARSEKGVGASVRSSQRVWRSHGGGRWARPASARCAIAALLVAELCLAFHAARAQQATLPAAVLSAQADDAASLLARQRRDAATALKERAWDAGASLTAQAAGAAGSIEQKSADAAAATVPRVPDALSPNPEFAHFPRYGGTLGARRIVLRLGKKTDDPTGVHGEYQFADTGAVVLVAGDREGDLLEIEDSDDGSSITGNWVGRFAPDGSLAGERMNPDDSDPQPFVLRPLADLSSTH